MTATRVQGEVAVLGDTARPTIKVDHIGTHNVRSASRTVFVLAIKYT